MTNLETLSNKPAAPSNFLPAFFPVFSAAGFIDATYLAAKHFLGTPIPCSILKGCEQVTTSQYSSLFGIPVALLGSIYYLTILVLAAIYFDSRKPAVLKLLACLTPFGFLASLWFVYLQIFIIKAICLYCMTSAATSTLLFIIGMTYLIKNRKKSEFPN
ncbi:MAG TPA: vitamin K epoxide reductase family protein [Candidatus Udaeobacter sp.]|nr:vitamin K epoxide reductase family protein [Candidatus Udaeobacter sp.]